MRWGSQWRDENNRVQLSINARSEKAAYTRFKHAVESRRCLVPASSFFEWDRSKEPSIPHLFGVTGQGAFWIAGAWEEPTAEFGAGYLVLTTKPNDLVQRIHDRMPVILRDDAARAWLSPGHLSQGKINEFCPSYPAAEMSDTVVSLLANNARNDGPECVEPYHAPDPSVTRPGELF